MPPVSAKKPRSTKVVPGGDIPRSKWSGPKGGSYSRDELRAGADLTGDEPSEVMPGNGKSSKRQTGSTQTILRPSGRIRHTGPAPKTREPYTPNELAAGADLDKGPKKPGLVDRIKGFFGGSKEKGTGAFEDAPGHYSPQQKVKYHQQKSDQLRTSFEKYRNMMNTADVSHRDAKRAAYAKKHMQRFHAAWQAHQNALKGLK